MWRRGTAAVVTSHSGGHFSFFHSPHWLLGAFPAYSVMIIGSQNWKGFSRPCSPTTKEKNILWSIDFQIVGWDAPVGLDPLLVGLWDCQTDSWQETFIQPYGNWNGTRGRQTWICPLRRVDWSTPPPEWSQSNECKLQLESHEKCTWGRNCYSWYLKAKEREVGSWHVLLPLRWHVTAPPTHPIHPPHPYFLSKLLTTPTILPVPTGAFACCCHTCRASGCLCWRPHSTWKQYTFYFPTLGLVLKDCEICCHKSTMGLGCPRHWWL